MLSINLLANPAATLYVSGLMELGAMTRLEPAHFEPGDFLDRARLMRDELDALEYPTRRLSGAISLFDDLAADRMLRPETARGVMGRVRAEPKASLIPGYDRFEAVGFGGYGVVYWALQEETGRHVAIKVGRLTQKGASSDSMKRVYTVERLRQVFQREFDFLKEIDSDRIVRVHETGLTERGKPYIVMEYMGGGNLIRFTRRLRSGEIDPTWETVYPVIKQVLEAAAALHERGIIHNDIKPENYLMGRDGQVKLTDFSIATTVEEAAKRGIREYRGTPGHMSIQTTESLNKDVYALGSTLYQILTGRAPFQQHGELAALGALLHGYPPPSTRRPTLDVPPELDRFVLKALSHKKEVQFKDAREMLASFRRLKPKLMRASRSR